MKIRGTKMYELYIYFARSNGFAGKPPYYKERQYGKRH
jgi:hypothetical protein